MAEIFGQRFDQHTDDVIATTNLLKELADREGEFVWKKYFTTNNPQFTLTVVQATNYLTLSNANFDLSLVDNIEFFTDFVSTGGDYPRFSVMNNELVYMVSAGTYVKVLFFDNVNLKVNLAEALSSKAEGTFTLSYTGTKVINQNSNIDYVVSDDPTAYPDGAEQDGYWYELVVDGNEGVDLLSILGASKVAVDKFMYSADTTFTMSLCLYHTLQDVPKGFLVLGASTNLESPLYIYMFYGINGVEEPTGAGVRRFLFAGYLHNTIASNRYGAPQAGTNNYEVSANNSYVALAEQNLSAKFKAGVEYTIITWV